jgi:hypothetical protein
VIDPELPGSGPVGIPGAAGQFLTSLITLKS